MSDGKPDTKPAGVVDSSPALTVEEDNEISPAAEMNVIESSSTAENISIADENLNTPIISDGVEPCGAEVVDASSENKEDDIVQDVSVQIEDAKVEDVDALHRTEDEQNAESISEVTEAQEKIVNEVETTNENDPKLLITAQDENEDEDVAQNNEQLSATDLPATATDTPTKINENKDTGAEQLLNKDESNATAETQTAPPKDDTVEPKKTSPPKESAPSVGLREVLFTDQGWSQLWTAIPDKQLTFTAPVLRVEAGRFFWSSETYNKR
jgi:hypothetical protein